MIFKDFKDTCNKLDEIAAKLLNKRVIHLIHVQTPYGHFSNKRVNDCGELLDYLSVGEYMTELESFENVIIIHILAVLNACGADSDCDTVVTIDINTGKEIPLEEEREIVLKGLLKDIQRKEDTKDEL